MTETQVTVLDEMIGATIDFIEGGEPDDDMLRLHANDGRSFLFSHWQDCCERVRIVDVDGDLSDLIGSPILMAEEVSQDAADECSESGTWTFYKFATAKGYVTVRWLGESNGYYSEGVSFEVEAAKAAA